ncbi:hypothetical protein Tco_0840996, partial [Tanacetum coccineum]
YLEACAAISITKDFKAYFRGTQPQWSNLDDDFADLLYQCFLSWIKEEWMRQSKVGAENRKKVPRDVEGTRSYVRHTAGSKSFRAHTHELVSTFFEYFLDE